MSWLTNQFLVAMPSLKDSLFEKSVVLIFMHNESGALGVVVNKESGFYLNDILQELNLDSRSLWTSKLPVLCGGPVEIQRGLILHDSRQTWSATIAVNRDLNLTLSSDVLEDISEDKGPELCLPLLGFSSWYSDQLENEIKNNYWLSTPADHRIIFDTPIHQRWKKAASLIGIDITSLSDFAGSA